MRKKDEKHPLRMLALITQLGIAMMTAIFIAALIGLKIGQMVHSDLVFPLFLVLGIMAGFRSCYHIITRFVSFRRNEEIESREVEKMDRRDQ